MTVIRWENPPPDRRGGGVTHHWQNISDQLREHPGQWAVILEAAPGPCGGWVNRIRNGKSAFRPAGSFEAVCRTDDGKGTVYARYVGGTS